MQKNSYILVIVLVIITILVVVGIVMWFRNGTSSTSGGKVGDEKQQNFTYEKIHQNVNQLNKNDNNASNTRAIDPLDEPLSELDMKNSVKLLYDKFIRKTNGKISKINKPSSDVLYNLGEDVLLNNLILNITDFKRKQKDQNDNLSTVNDDANKELVIKYYDFDGKCVLKLKYDVETEHMEVNGKFAGIYKNSTLKSITIKQNSQLLKWNNEILTDLEKIPTIRFIHCQNLHDKTLMFITTPDNSQQQ